MHDDVAAGTPNGTIYDLDSFCHPTLGVLKTCMVYFKTFDECFENVTYLLTGCRDLK